MSEELENPVKKMKPVIILPKGAMSKKDIRLLNDNFFCVVEAKDPSAIRFQEPPPLGYSTQERAAIALGRRLLMSNWTHSIDKGGISSAYVEILMQGDPLDQAMLKPVTSAEKPK